MEMITSLYRETKAL